MSGGNVLRQDSEPCAAQCRGRFDRNGSGGKTQAEDPGRDGWRSIRFPLTVAGGRAIVSMGDFPIDTMRSSQS